jgi:hypothetical protein
MTAQIVEVMTVLARRTIKTTPPSKLHSDPTRVQNQDLGQLVRVS